MGIKSKESGGKSAVEIIAEAVHLLRLAPLDLHLTYWAGGLPFILGLLFFITDMSHNAYAPERCAGGALGLTIGFVWMKTWQALFARRLHACLVGETPQRMSVRRFLTLMFRQTIVQPTGFLLLPLSLLAVLPSAWVFAFYQNDMVLATNGSGLMPSVRQSIHMTRPWPLQNHLIIAILSALGLVVFLNIGTAVVILPYLLKKILAIDTVFTVSGASVFNTTLLSVSAGVTYLCIDPLVKTAYVLRCFYGSAITSGEDLKIELKHLLSVKKTAALLAIWLVLMPVSTQADRLRLAPDEQENIAVSKLDQAIDAVMAKPEYTWRLPRKETLSEDSRNGPFDAIGEWIQPAWITLKEALSALFRKLADWFFHRWDNKQNTSDQSRKSVADWMSSVQALLFGLLCLVAGMLAIYIYRAWRQKTKTLSAAASPAASAIPDIRDDSVSAEDLPTDRWLDLARELIDNGSYRLALRAIYLATLAFLADRQMIIIAGYKSNRDYDRELRRRSHGKESLNDLFTSQVALFDRVWYGMQTVYLKDVQAFSSNHERIVTVAE